MIVIPNHAREEMENDGIGVDDVEQCVKHGELEIKQTVNGEMRYGKKLEMKDKTIVVIYTHRGADERVVTAYTVRRKSIWEKK